MLLVGALFLVEHRHRRAVLVVDLDVLWAEVDRLADEAKA